jgi:NAD(P)-dependent dehydrogenase (short-subunit alcohol dehydrogenase family)
MTESPYIYQQPATVTLDTLEDTLLAAFLTVREALTGGGAVVVVVRDADLLGHGQSADAALAGGLVGMVRALAIEGVRDGWQINALALSGAVSDEQREIWIERLVEPAGATGELFRLGELHLGRVSV